MNLREVGCDPGEWIDLAEDKGPMRGYVRAEMNLRVPSKPVSYYSSSFYRKQIHIFKPIYVLK